MNGMGNKVIYLRTKADELRYKYRKQLKSEKWYAFRNKVFKKRGKRCENCGNTLSLQVHHLSYKTGHKPWEYDICDVVVLCRDCHAKIHGIK